MALRSTRVISLPVLVIVTEPKLFGFTVLSSVIAPTPLKMALVATSDAASLSVMLPVEVIFRVVALAPDKIVSLSSAMVTVLPVTFKESKFTVPELTVISLVN